MKNVWLTEAAVIFIIILVSCQSINSVEGKYITTGKNYWYKLEINNNGNFIYSGSEIEFQFGCKGKWRKVGDSLLLKCNDQPLEEQLVTGYLSKRQMQLFVLNGNTLRFEKLTLKRIKK